MDLDNRSVDKSVFKIWITVHGVEKTLKHTGLRPSSKSLENRIPVAEPSGQVTPWRACSHAPKNGLHEPAVVSARCSRIPGLAGQQRRNLLPKFIRNNQAIFVHSNLHFGSLNQSSEQKGTPIVNRPYKGFGWTLVQAVGNNDIELMMAVSVVAVFVVLITQLISDIGYVFLNPRIRVS